MIALFLWTGATRRDGARPGCGSRLPILVAGGWPAARSPCPRTCPLAEAVRRAQEAEAGSIVTVTQRRHADRHRQRGRPARDARGAPSLAGGHRRSPVRIEDGLTAARPTSPARTLVRAISQTPGRGVPPGRGRRRHLRRPRDRRRRARLPRRPGTRVRRMTDPAAPCRQPDVPAEAWSGVHRGPLREGEWVRLTDAKGRRHNFCLESRQAVLLQPRPPRARRPDRPRRGLHRHLVGGRRVPRVPAAALASSWSRCRAAPPSSTPRTPPRSSRWPTSSRAPAWSRPASAPAR